MESFLQDENNGASEGNKGNNRGNYRGNRGRGDRGGQGRGDRGGQGRGDRGGQGRGDRGGQGRGDRGGQGRGDRGGRGREGHDYSKNNFNAVQVQVMIREEDPPYNFKLKVIKSELSQSTEFLCQQINIQLMQLFANVTQILKDQQGKNEICFYFNISDKEQAIECFKFYDNHFKRKNDNQETQFPQEIIKIYFNLNNPLKIQHYVEQFKPKSNNNIHNNNSQMKNQKNTSFQIQGIQNQFNLLNMQQNQLQNNSFIQQQQFMLPQNNITTYNQQFNANSQVLNPNINNVKQSTPFGKTQSQMLKDQAKAKQQQEQMEKQKQQEIVRKKQAEERKKQIELLNNQKKEKQVQEKTIFEVMNTMHTFSNPEYDKIREELLSGNILISMSDQKNDIKIKQKLDSGDLVGDLDPSETFSCKICYEIVLDPKECDGCSALICLNCILEYRQISDQCPNCLQEIQNNFQKLNRNVKNQYEKLIFKCPYDDQCSFQGPTQQAYFHLTICEMFQKECPNKCSKWVAQRDLENHAKYFCQQSEIMCLKCETLDKPLQPNFHHNCFQVLKRMVQKQQSPQKNSFI